jgi:hypothetical protein
MPKNAEMIGIFDYNLNGKNSHRNKTSDSYWSFNDIKRILTIVLFSEMGTLAFSRKITYGDTNKQISAAKAEHAGPRTRSTR